MMTKRWSLLLVIVWIISMLAACGAPEATPTPQPVPPTATTVPPTDQPTAIAPTTSPRTQRCRRRLSQRQPLAENPLYLSIIWHQHQPIYFKDPATGIYQKPWVRVHAAKDYVDMAAMLENYPDVQVTFNLTPSLLRQLQDLAAGAKDLYQVLHRNPCRQPDRRGQAFILHVSLTPIPRSSPASPATRRLPTTGTTAPTGTPRRGATCRCSSTWPGPTPTGWPQEPLASLVAKGQNYAEEDKAIVLGEHAQPGGRGDPAAQAAARRGPHRSHHDPLLPPDPAARPGHQPGGRPPCPTSSCPTATPRGFDAMAQIELGVKFYTEALRCSRREACGRPKARWPSRS